MKDESVDRTGSREISSASLFILTSAFCLLTSAFLHAGLSLPSSGSISSSSTFLTTV
jgi:hypothetical protein